MTETLLSLVAEQGVFILFLTTFFSCLALPVPASLLMLTGGAFVASGDLSAAETFVACLLGAVAGDQTGFLLAQQIEKRLSGFLEKHPDSKSAMAKARVFSERWGGPGVFFSRWLFSPLGPYVNFTVGAAGVGWLRFTIWDLLGEITWVCIYLGLGFSFANQIESLSALLGNISGLLAALVVTMALGFALRRALHPPKKAKPAASKRP